MADGTEIMFEIANLVILEVQFHIQIKKIQNLLRHQAQTTVDVLIAMHGIGIGIT